MIPTIVSLIQNSPYSSSKPFIQLVLLQSLITETDYVLCSPEWPAVAEFGQFLEDLLTPLQLQRLPAHSGLGALSHLHEQQYKNWFYSADTNYSKSMTQTSMSATNVVYCFWVSILWVCWLFSYQFIDVRRAVGASFLFAALTTWRRLLGFTFGVFLPRWGLLVFLPWSHCREITERWSVQQGETTPVGTGKL